jgi:RNA polymerase II subunit A-like phosphatase
MGTRSYAHAVANVLDPTRKFFSDRILSRDDSGSLNDIYKGSLFKSIQRLFPCDQSMVVAVDDRGDVWNWVSNLIKVRPCKDYIQTDNFFDGAGDINEPGRDPVVPGTEQANQKLTKLALNDDDSTLEMTLTALEELHRRFYESLDTKKPADVGNILPSIKEEVLKNVYIVFSGIIPTNQDPKTHELWIWATQYGAICEKDITEKTTHVIASKVYTINSRLALPKLMQQWHSSTFGSLGQSGIYC